MKIKAFNCLIFIFLLLSPLDALSQSISVFDVDTSEFPTVKASFFAFDNDRIQAGDLSPADFNITEDGTDRQVISVSCPEFRAPVAISAVLTIDVSSSMNGLRLESAKSAAGAFIDALPDNGSECAITSFNVINNVLRDFTTDKTRLADALSNLSTGASTTFDAAFINPPAGALTIIEKAKYKRIVIILSDGVAPGNESAIIQRAKSTNTAVYCVTLGNPAPEILKNISELTGGEWFEYVVTKDEVESIYLRILRTAQSDEPVHCSIEWESGINCISRKKAEIVWNSFGVKDNFKYSVGDEHVAVIEVDPFSIIFKNIPPSSQKDTIIKVTAFNSDFEILDITSTNPLFSISPTAFSLERGSSRDIIVSFNPSGFNFENGIIEIITDLCNSKIYAGGIHFAGKERNSILEIVRPNGGEKFLACSDTIITWQGVLPTDTVSLSYSTDAGASWSLITNSATGLEYHWNVPDEISSTCLMKATFGNPDYKDSTVFNPINLTGHNFSVTHTEFSPDGMRVLTSAGDSKIILWNSVTGAPVNTFEIEDSELTLARFNNSGTQILTKSESYNIYIWDATTFGRIHTLKGHANNITQAVYSPMGELIASSSDDNTAIIWDVASGSLLYSLKGHTDDVRSVRFSPDSKLLVTASEDNTAIIWDAGSGDLLFTLSGHTDKVGYAVFSPDGKYIVTVSDDNTAKAWNPADGSLIATFSGHTDRVKFAAFSPNKQYVVTASDDNTAQVWGMATGSLVHVLSGHSDWVAHAEFSPDGSLVVTASWDQTAKIWNAPTGDLLYTLAGHTGKVPHAAFSPGGNRIATSSDDWTAKIWPLDDFEIYLEDTSDSLWAIVAPELFSLDVDMGPVVVGDVKDSVVTEFLSNNGSLAVRIDSIRIAGPDAGQFMLISGIPPYIIEANDVQACEFRFAPASVGYKTADIFIYTSIGEMISVITGMGTEQLVQARIIDFGLHQIGETVDTVAVVVENISGRDILFDSVVMLGPHISQFQYFLPEGEYIISPTDTMEMNLMFEPRYIGRASSRIGLYYKGEKVTDRIQLFGAGIGGLVHIADDSAYAGEKFRLSISLQNISTAKLQQFVDSVRGVIRVQRTILAPARHSNLIDVINDSTYISFAGRIDTSTNVISKLKLVAGLGNVEQTTIDIVEFSWFGHNGELVDFEADRQSGMFKLLGVCPEGGDRLLNPDKDAGLLSIYPNPANESVEITFDLIEKGRTELILYGILGEKIATIYDLASEPGRQSISFSTKDIPSGAYYIIMRTPTITKTQRLEIVR